MLSSRWLTVLLSVSDLFWLGKLVKKGWRQGEGGSRVASGVDGWSWCWVFFFNL